MRSCQWVPRSQTANSAYYLGVMKCLPKRVCRKRLWEDLWDLWEDQFWVLHQVNAPSQTAVIFTQFLTKTAATAFEHPSYSPNVAP